MIHLGLIRRIGVVLMFAVIAPTARTAASTAVPDRFVFCQTQITLTPDAQAKVQEQVDKIRRNLLAFQVLVERAELHFPVLEDALFRIGVPEDLKYIAIQESGLRGDAISTSNAVGYWQFKDFTAREVGLNVSSTLDERRHIFRSTVGAARYFAKNYLRHRNWVYAIISYYAGGTGAIPYIRDEYVGVDYITLDGDIHWYLAKAIAHKFAYEPEMGQATNQQPWLEAVDTRGETDPANLIELSGNAPDVFRLHNRWIMGQKLNPNTQISMYVLHEKGQRKREPDPYAHLYPPELQDWKPVWNPRHIVDGKPAPVSKKRPVKEEITPEVQAAMAAAQLREIYIEDDPEYGKEYTMITRQFNLVDAALKYGVKPQRLKEWNGIKPYEHPPVGSVISLSAPRKARFHLAREMETIEDVASRYGRSVSKLRQLNRLENGPGLLKPGQKIYLKDEKPAEEPVIVVLTAEKASVTAPVKSFKPAPEKQSIEMNVTAEDTAGAWRQLKSVKTPNPLIYREGEAEAVHSFGSEQPVQAKPDRYPQTAESSGANVGEKLHEVQTGDTFWSIARKYGVDVATLRKANSLDENHVLKIGERLTIPTASVPR